MRFLLPLVALAALAAPGAEGGRPLPVDRTRKLIEEGAVWTVEGRVRIPRGVELTILRSNTIRGIGSEPAVIEVEGGLDAVGVFGREIAFENVVVEPQPRFERIHTDMVVFTGAAGIRTGKDAAVEGSLLAENTDFVKGAALDVAFGRGSVEVSSVCADGMTSVRAPLLEGGKSGRVRIFVRNCDQLPMHKCTPHGGRTGLKGGLEVTGGDDVTIQFSRIGGRLAAVRNWERRLIFDGNKINAERLEFTQGEAGRFAGVQCTKSDIYAAKVLASAPVKKGTRDTLTMDRCWFRGVAELKKVLDDIVLDGADDTENNGVRVQLPKINTRAMGLAGDEDK